MSNVGNFEVGPDVQAAWDAVGFTSGIDLHPDLSAYGDLSEFLKPRKLDLTTLWSHEYDDWHESHPVQTALKATLGTYGLRTFPVELTTLLSRWARQREAGHAVAAVSLNHGASVEPNSWTLAIFDDDKHVDVNSLGREIRKESLDPVEMDPRLRMIDDTIFRVVDVLSGLVTIVSGGRRLDISLGQDDLMRYYEYSSLRPIAGMLVMSRIPHGKQYRVPVMK